MSTIAQKPQSRPVRRVAAPLNCSILLTDITGFGDPARDDHHRLQLRSALSQVLIGSFADAGLPWRRCRHHDRGDGLLTVVPPTISTTPLVEAFLPRLAGRLGRYNATAEEPVRLRLRCALHVGPVLVDGTGYPSASIIHASRMLDSGPLRRELSRTDVNLAVMVSDYVYEAVVRHLARPADRDGYRAARYRAKGVPITSWLQAVGGPGDEEGSS